jgi:hypothetical protein
MLNAADIAARHAILNTLAQHSRGVDRADAALAAAPAEPSVRSTLVSPPPCCVVVYPPLL